MTQQIISSYQQNSHNCREFFFSRKLIVSLQFDFELRAEMVQFFCFPLGFSAIIYCQQFTKGHHRITIGQSEGEGQAPDKFSTKVTFSVQEARTSQNLRIKLHSSLKNLI